MKHVSGKNIEQKHPVEVDAHDFIKHHRNQFWYVGIGILVAAFIYLSFYTKNYLGVAVAIAAGLAIFRVAHFEPQTRKVKISERGVFWGDQFFGYHKIRAFWVTSVEDRFTVYLERLNFSMPITFIIPATKAEAVVDYLSKHLPWHDHKSEPLSDKFGRFLKI